QTSPVGSLPMLRTSSLGSPSPSLKVVQLPVAGSHWPTPPLVAAQITPDGSLVRARTISLGKPLATVWLLQAPPPLASGSRMAMPLPAVAIQSRPVLST